MRYLVLSDIHSNLEALEAVLEAAAVQRYDSVLVLGDLVGYGADPNAVVERIRGMHPALAIRGNHDKVAAGLEEPDSFNAVAREAARWTRQVLTADSLEYLRALAKGPCLVDDALEICHGSPLDEDLYLFEETDAMRALDASQRPVCLFGHTHVATVTTLHDRAPLDVRTPRGSGAVEVRIEAARKYLINPGSVGQPRDGDSRAAYLIADVGRLQLTLHRVAYPIEAAQAKILAAGLPPLLAQRLRVGR